MPEIELTDRFKKAYAELPEQIKKKIRKAIRLLANDPRHPSLQTKPIQGAKGLYEARADRAYRMTYERSPGDVLRLRVVGKHDEASKNP
ncbi:MAG: type II toxin-antitoxin system RelE/ParE family toxin [Anaerolineales bacterium]|nr:type II toxin-antitoxin system RelE/ParE family toxin [Anaerolineales bacterium]